MTNTAKQLYRGTVSTTTTTTLYTVPASTTTLVSTIIVANITSSAATFTLTLGGTSIFKDVSIGANSSIVVDNSRQVLSATQTIQGGSNTASAVTFSISGTEIT